MSLVEIFSKIFQVAKKSFLWKCIKVLEGQYVSIRILPRSEFAICAFDKNCSMFYKWAV